MRFGAVRRPGGVHGVECRVVAEHPVADLVQDKDLLLAITLLKTAAVAVAIGVFYLTGIY